MVWLFSSQQKAQWTKKAVKSENIFKRADLLGAIRLPNTAFKNAGTKVTADILFLQKREKERENPEWISIVNNEDGIRVNSYFAAHPEMVLGTMQEVTGPYGLETACIEKKEVL